MSALARITRRSAWHWVITASIVSSDNLGEEAMPQHLTGIVEHHQHSLECVLLARMGMLHKSHQPGLEEPLKVAPPDHCVSSMNHLRGRSPGSYLWRSSELSLLPGNDVRDCRKIGNNNHLCFGEPGYLRWVSSSALRLSFISATCRRWLRPSVRSLASVW